jgi:hypothetical protein
MNEEVTHRWVSRRRDRPAEDGKRRVGYRFGDAFDSLSETGQRNRDTAQHARCPVVVHADDQCSAVDRERCKVARQFPILGLARQQLSLELEVMALFKQALLDRLLKVRLGLRRPARYCGRQVDRSRHLCHIR